MPAPAYRPAHCAAVVAHMATGASLTSFAAEAGVSRATVDGWIADHPDFAAAVELGKAKCAAWWEDVHRRIATDGGKTGSVQACALGLRNMAAQDWGERADAGAAAGDIARAIEDGNRRVMGDA